MRILTTEQGCNSNWIPTLIGSQKWQTLIYVLCNDPGYQWTWLDIVHLPLVDLKSIYSHGYIGAKKGKYKDTYQHQGCMNQITKISLQHSQHLSNKTWYNLHIIHLLWQLNCGSTFQFHTMCASFGICHQSTRVFIEPRSKCHARYQHQTNHGDPWLAEEIMALSPASSGIACP